MKYFLVLTMLASTSAFALGPDSLECSNPDGTLRYSEWNYNGGAKPPEDMPTREVKWILSGDELSEEAGEFTSRKKIVSRKVARCETLTTYVVKAKVQSIMDLPSFEDVVFCREKLPTCPRP